LYDARSIFLILPANSLSVQLFEYCKRLPGSSKLTA